MSSPELSIVVILYNMVREAPRTLYSLSRAFQEDVDDLDYEVIAIDNGSPEPLNALTVAQFGGNFRYHYFKTDSVSPAEAVNHGVSIAAGRQVALIVDGARMASPGLIGASLRAARAVPDSFVGALAWHLGPKVQWDAAAEGYDQAEEDRLLQSIDWRNNGYRLFEIATIAPSSVAGILGGIPPECSWFVMPRQLFVDLGGYDARFCSPGGGLVNHEFMQRVVLRYGDTIVMLVGEGTFHQIHGGITTSSEPGHHPLGQFMDEYRSLFGVDYQRPDGSVSPFYFGRLPPTARRFIATYG